jgi:hypothetical protein
VGVLADTIDPSLAEQLVEIDSSKVMAMLTEYARPEVAALLEKNRPWLDEVWGHVRRLVQQTVPGNGHPHPRNGKARTNAATSA